MKEMMTDPQHPPPPPFDASDGLEQSFAGPDEFVTSDTRPIAGLRIKPSDEPNPDRRAMLRYRTRTYFPPIRTGPTTNPAPLFRSPLFVSNQSSRPTPTTTTQGEGDDAFDATSEGNHDEYETAIHAGRKKRKTPAFQMSSGPGRHEGFAVYDGDVVDGTDRHADLPPLIPGQDDEDGDEDDEGRDRDLGQGLEDDDDVDAIDAAESATLALQRQIRSNRRLRSISTQSCDFRRLQFLRRKAALITLFLDATSAIKNYWKDEKPGGAHTKSLVGKLPEVESFEKLLPALEDVGVGDWPPDRPEWRNGYDDQAAKRRLGVWRTKFAKRRKIREGRKEIVRGGWAPEGSFELEIPSKSGAYAREGAKARAALQRLATELRHILLTVKPKSQVTPEPEPKSKPAQNHPPTKAKRRINTSNPQTPGDGSVEQTPGSVDQNSKDGGELERTASGSKDSEAGSGVGGKKKTKKKKRSVLANQSNPHHVDNYRPSRIISQTGDPTEPYPHHASLLFPPPMAFLAARPGSARVRPSEDDYICCFCEYDLFYGSEARRKAAIRKRRQELKRKENIKNKAKNVAEGKGKINEESEYEDGDEDGECADEGYGKCSCGRALGPHGEKEHHLKPPDPDPNIPLPPPSGPSASITSIPEIPRLNSVHSQYGEYEDSVSRASTPSID